MPVTTNEYNIVQDVSGKKLNFAKQLTTYQITGKHYSDALHEWFFLEGPIKFITNEPFGFIGHVQIDASGNAVTDNGKHHNLTKYAGAEIIETGGKRYVALNDAGLNTTPHIYVTQDANDVSWANYCTYQVVLRSAFYDFTPSSLWGVHSKLGAATELTIPKSVTVPAKETKTIHNTVTIGAQDQILRLRGYAGNAQGMYIQDVANALSITLGPRIEANRHVDRLPNLTTINGIRFEISMYESQFLAIKSTVTNIASSTGLFVYSSVKLARNNVVPDGWYRGLYPRDNDNDPHVAVYVNNGEITHKGNIVLPLHGVIIQVYFIKVGNRYHLEFHGKRKEETDKNNYRLKLKGSLVAEKGPFVIPVDIMQEEVEFVFSAIVSSDGWVKRTVSSYSEEEMQWMIGRGAKFASAWVEEITPTGTFYEVIESNQITL